jgi:hypothetical protein
MENEFDPSIYSSKLEVENMLNELENVDNKMLRQ